MLFFQEPGWHLAISGKDFAVVKNYFPEWLKILAVKGAVFSRMGPDQKTDLIEVCVVLEVHPAYSQLWRIRTPKEPAEAIRIPRSPDRPELNTSCSA